MQPPVFSQHPPTRASEEVLEENKHQLPDTHLSKSMGLNKSPLAKEKPLLLPNIPKPLEEEEKVLDMQKSPDIEEPKLSQV